MASACQARVNTSCTTSSSALLAECVEREAVQLARVRPIEHAKSLAGGVGRDASEELGIGGHQPLVIRAGPLRGSTGFREPSWREGPRATRPYGPMKVEISRPHDSGAAWPYTVSRSCADSVARSPRSTWACCSWSRSSSPRWPRRDLGREISRAGQAPRLPIGETSCERSTGVRNDVDVARGGSKASRASGRGTRIRAARSEGQRQRRRRGQRRPVSAPPAHRSRIPDSDGDGYGDASDPDSRDPDLRQRRPARRRRPCSRS